MEGKNEAKRENIRKKDPITKGSIKELVEKTL